MQKKRHLRLTAEEIEHLDFLASLSEEDWNELTGTLDSEDLIEIINLIGEFRDGVEDVWMERHGTPDADKLISQLMGKS